MKKCIPLTALLFSVSVSFAQEERAPVTTMMHVDHDTIRIEVLTHGYEMGNLVIEARDADCHGELYVFENDNREGFTDFEVVTAPLHGIVDSYEDGSLYYTLPKDSVFEVAELDLEQALFDSLTYTAKDASGNSYRANIYIEALLAPVSVMPVQHSSQPTIFKTVQSEIALYSVNGRMVQTFQNVALANIRSQILSKGIYLAKIKDMDVVYKYNVQ